MSGEQYTFDNTEKGIVSDAPMIQPMQQAQIKGNIPEIRAYKDARTARIKAIGESNQKAVSVGVSVSQSMGKGTPFRSDFI